MAAQPPLTCNWRNDLPCQFPPEQNGGVTQWQGRSYCYFHLPLSAGAPKRGLTDDEDQFLRHAQNLKGVQFVARQYVFHAHAHAA
jgi:hypothetical protein